MNYWILIERIRFYNLSTIRILELKRLYFELSDPIEEMINITRLSIRNVTMTAEVTRSLICSQSIKVLKLTDVNPPVSSITSNLHHLQELNLSLEKQVDFEQVNQLILKCQQSQQLRVVKIRYHGYGSPLCIDSLSHLLWSQHDNIQVLKLDKIKLDIDKLPHAFENLTELEIEDTEHSYESLIKLLKKCNETLQYLHLDLRGVNISSNFDLHLPSLKYIYISEASFSKGGLVALLKSCFQTIEAIILLNVYLQSDLDPIDCCPPHLEIIDLDSNACRIFNQICVNSNLKQIFLDNNSNKF